MERRRRGVDQARGGLGARSTNSELVFVGYGVVAPEFDWDDYKGARRQGQDARDARQRSAGARSGERRRARSEDVRRQGDDLLRPLDLQVRDRRAEGRGRRADHPRDRAGRLSASTSCRGRPASSSISSRPTRTWAARRSKAGSRSTRRRSCCKIGRAGFRRAEEAGGDARLQAGAARRDRVDDDRTTRCARSTRATSSRSSRARDPTLKDEYVVYTAHWDHFGKNADGIFHGAEDDALGCAALIEMARAFTKLPAPPRRSILFLAVTAEEQGLLGSQYYAVTPIYPLAKTVADINMDSWNVHGRTKDMTLVGYGASDLDDYARDAAGRAGARRARATPSRRRASTTARITSTSRSRACRRSIPDGGVDYIGKPADYGAEGARGVERASGTTRRPTSCMPDWDLTGAREDLQGALRGRLPRGAGGQDPGVEAGQRVQGEARRDAQEQGLGTGDWGSGASRARRR